MKCSEAREKWMLNFLTAFIILLNLANSFVLLVNYQETFGLPLIFNFETDVFHHSSYGAISYDYMLGPAWKIELDPTPFPIKIIYLKTLFWIVSAFGWVLSVLNLKLGKFISVLAFSIFLVFLFFSLFFIPTSNFELDWFLIFLIIGHKLVGIGFCVYLIIHFLIELNVLKTSIELPGKYISVTRKLYKEDGIFKGLLFLLIFLNIAVNGYWWLTFQNQFGQPKIGSQDFFGTVVYDYLMGPNPGWFSQPYDLSLIKSKLICWFITTIGAFLYSYRIKLGKYILVLSFSLFSLYLVFGIMDQFIRIQDLIQQKESIDIFAYCLIISHKLVGILICYFIISHASKHFSNQVKLALE